MMMGNEYCPDCGVEATSSGETFCPKCDQPLPTPGQKLTMANERIEFLEKQEKKANSFRHEIGEVFGYPYASCDYLVLKATEAAAWKAIAVDLASFLVRNAYEENCDCQDVGHDITCSLGQALAAYKEMGE